MRGQRVRERERERETHSKRERERGRERERPQTVDGSSLGMGSQGCLHGVHGFLYLELKLPRLYACTPNSQGLPGPSNAISTTPRDQKPSCNRAVRREDL